jgi:SHS2 domain-containing protein
MTLATRSYELMDHTADAMVKVRGRGLSALLANSAFAMFDLQYGLEPVLESEERVVEVNAPDKETLLVRLLSMLLSVSEGEWLVFRRFDVDVGRTEAGSPGPAGPSASSSLRARCVARGERFDPARHVRHIHVKAVTYHMLDVDEGRGEAVIVFDK